MGLTISLKDDEETWTLELDGEVIASDYDDDELAQEVYELIDDGDLDAYETVRIDGRARIAAELCTPEDQRRLGYVIGAKRPADGFRPKNS
jgi:hypothetical protein